MAFRYSVSPLAPLLNLNHEIIITYSIQHLLNRNTKITKSTVVSCYTEMGGLFTESGEAF